ncbi:MAG: hypothetical protein QOH96_153 [Blastocatellia bacterium]|nr:hypothetical protein [Blastocatellia bacterium]
MAAPSKLLHALTVEDSLTSKESGRKTVSIVFGTRPEAIKLAPVIAELSKRVGEFHTAVVNSGQHDSLLAPFLAPMGVKIDHDLRVMTRDQSPGSVCARVMAGLGDDLSQKKLILRMNTERPESIECGNAKLVGEQPGQLEVLLEDACARGNWTEQVSFTRNPFGDGKSGARIATLICELLGAPGPEAACIGI